MLSGVYRHRPPDEFGPSLRAARLARGLSQKRLAKLAGIAYGFVSQLERGERSPSSVVAGRLVDVLGLHGDAAAAMLAVGVEGVGHAAARQLPYVNRARLAERIGRPCLTPGCTRQHVPTR